MNGKNKRKIFREIRRKDGNEDDTLPALRRRAVQRLGKAAAVAVTAVCLSVVLAACTPKDSSETDSEPGSTGKPADTVFVPTGTRGETRNTDAATGTLPAETEMLPIETGTAPAQNQPTPTGSTTAILPDSAEDLPEMNVATPEDYIEMLPDSGEDLNVGNP